MKQRCYNPKNVRYENYGGRGIKVCDRWLNSFPNFLEDMGDRPEGMTLDRIHNNVDYEPSNCRWETYSNQNINRGLKKNNTSGYKHINWNKSLSYWVVRIKRNGKDTNYGYFKSIEDAVTKRDEIYKVKGI